MDPAAFLALALRCAPGSNPEPLAAIVRRASGYRPLSLRFDGGPGRSMTLQPSDRLEAIQLASELVVAGHRVRIGLAGLDTRDLDRLGLTLTEAFEPCSHVKAAAQLMSEDPSRLKPPSPAKGEVRQGAETLVAPGSVPQQPIPEPRPVRAWDVYGQGRLSSALIYGGLE